MCPRRCRRKRKSDGRPTIGKSDYPQKQLEVLEPIPSSGVQTVLLTGYRREFCEWGLGLLQSHPRLQRVLLTPQRETKRGDSRHRYGTGRLPVTIKLHI